MDDDRPCIHLDLPSSTRLSAYALEKLTIATDLIRILYLGSLLGANAPLGLASSEGLYVCLYVCMSVYM